MVRSSHMVRHQPDTIAASHLTPRCVSCGYFGPDIDPPQRHCPCCSCDLTERPPRSYAQMEGFVATADEPMLQPVHWREIAEQQRLASLQRWLTAAFFAVLILVAMLFVLVLIVTAE